MKQFPKYLVLFLMTILTVSVLVTASIVYTAHAATNTPAKTTVVNIALTAKTVQLFTNQTINQEQTLNSGFTTTQGYKKVAIYVSVNTCSLQISGQFSIDGTNGYDDLGMSNTFATQNPGAGQTVYSMAADDVVGPSFRVAVSNNCTNTPPSSATFSVTLYLM